MKPATCFDSSRKDLPVAPNGRHVVAIDVGQRHHAAAAISAGGQEFGRVLCFENNRAGIDRLDQLMLKPLEGPSRILIGMEATGHYWMPLYFELCRRGFHCIVINPIQTRSQFRCRIRKTKTDKLDARSIAQLIFSGKAKAARVPSEATFELRLLTRQRSRLLHWSSDLQCTALGYIDRLFPEYHDHFSTPLLAAGRALIRDVGLDPQELVNQSDQVAMILSQASRKVLRPEKIQSLLQLAEHSIGIRIGQRVLVQQLRSLLALIESIELQIKELDAQLQTRVEGLHSPLLSLGLNAPLVATLHAETDPISDFRHPWQYAAFAGLDPSTFQTGNFMGTRSHISKRGSPHLRYALYLSAFVLYRRHTVLRRLYQKSRDRGRVHTDALNIVAHKLARIIWRLLTDNRPYRARAPRLLTLNPSRA